MSKQGLLVKREWGSIRTRSLYDNVSIIRQSSYMHFISISIIIKGIYIAQVRKGHKCAVSAEMAVWLRNCL